MSLRALVYIACTCWQLKHHCTTTVDQQGHVQPNLERPAAIKPWRNQHNLETILITLARYVFFLFLPAEAG